MEEQNEFLEILEQARTGDAVAMEQLVSQYEPQVRTVVRYRLDLRCDLSWILWM